MSNNDLFCLLHADFFVGNFGRVYKCQLVGNTVAAKSAKSGNSDGLFEYE